MRFGVLGPLAVWADDGSAVAIPDAKVRALLADLVLSAGRPVPADRLIDDLWGGRPPRNASGTLQARVSQLRTALGDRSLVAHRPPGYLLDVPDSAVDSARFQALVAEARDTSSPRARAGLLADALALWRGPALADFADHPFAQPAIARLEEERMTALEDQAEVRLSLGEHGALAASLTELVGAHPLRERLRAVHMTALYRAGRQGEALASFREVRTLLADELGVDPAPELTALHEAILRHDPSLAAATAPSSNVPAALNPLIGRDAALAEVGALLESARLVTLTGPGGVGKTTLALEVARRADATGGTWLVELAAAVRGTEVAELVAASLGLRDDSGQPAADRLAASFGDRQVLLVLDNCEQVVEQVAGLAKNLLEAAPGLRILATSREPLGLSFEHLCAVEALDGSSAAELFVARASASAPGFALNADNAAAVASICRRLDGIPLALELAATRVRTLGVRELDARLDDRFKVLDAGPRDAPARQRTLRAVIDWSWELLSEAERTVLGRLAVHADGCTLEAAEAVCAEDGLDVLDLLTRLVDRSLVTVVDGPRYRLLESVAAYCMERLPDPERIRARHRGYYTELAERAERHLRGHGQREWLARLDAETANLRLALDGAPAELALRLVNALSWYWYLRGRLTEARRSLTAALASAPGPGAPRDDAADWLAGMSAALGEPVERRASSPRAEWFLAFVDWAYGDFADTEARVNSALDDLERLGDTWGVAAALSTRAKLAMARGDLAATKSDGERGLALFRELGDPWGQIEASDSLAILAEITGDYERAARLRADELRLAEELGLWTQVPFKLASLGRVAMLTGDYAHAEELHERALALAAGQSNRSGQEFAEVGLGLLARRQGRLDEAETRLRAWLDWLGDVHGEAGRAFILAELGFVAEQRGDAVQALSLQLDGHAAATATGDPRAIALAMEGLAGARSLAGQAEEAAGLLEAAAALRASVGTPLPAGERGDVDRIMERLETMQAF